MNLAQHHFVSVFRENAKKYANNNIIFGKQNQKWEGITWKNFAETSNLVSKALLSLNVEPQETIAIFSQNTPKWIITDVGVQQIKAVIVPIYATNTSEQALYVLNHAEVKVLFVGDQEQYDKAIEIVNQCPSLKKIVAYKDEIEFKENKFSVRWNDFLALGNSAQYETELEKRVSERNINDLFTVIYTSGTTGNPKGVMLDYENLASQYVAHRKNLEEVSPKDASLAFLPLSHVFERIWSLYCLYNGANIYFLENPLEIRSALTEVKPTIMCAVPRFYEKIFATVHDMAEKSSFAKRLIFKFATFTGKKVLEKRLNNETPSFLLRLGYAFSDKVVFSKFKRLLGGRIRFMPCGGANLEPAIGRFFQSIGVNLLLGYGMTETTATVSFWNKDFNLKSVGKLMPDVDVKIGENNEILVKGKIVMKGYYKNPEETQKAFTADGFLRTGDAGNLDSDNNLFITERIKELMKTSNGKYIAPQFIEGKVGKYNLIEQIAVIADGKNFVSALIVPNLEILKQAMEEVNVKYKSTTDFLKSTQVIDYISKQLQRFQHDLPDYEKIKKFTLLPNAFTIERNEITPTLKLKRSVIYKNYKKEIEAMYC